MKRMSAKEFRELGLLHEVNRRVLHPIGLALEVIIDSNDKTYFGQVWDKRDDPEGIIFAGGIDRESLYKVRAMEDKVRSIREKALGYWIQR